MSDIDSSSPLHAAIHDDEVNQLLQEIRRSVATQTPLVVRSGYVGKVRRKFIESIESGEQNLHAFAKAVLGSMNPSFSAETQGQLMVFGRCKNEEHEGLLREDTRFDLQDDEFLKKSDSALATEHAPLCSVCGEKTESIASFIQYKPKQVAPFLFIRTRIKSTSHIAYKVADMVFDIDRMFRRDKIPSIDVPGITDIYGMKAIVPEDSDIPSMRKRIQSMDGVKVLEEKDYTGTNRKKSGFEAHKIVLDFNHWVIEVQIQSKRMFDIERQGYKANHQTYKEKQMEERRKLGKEYTVLYEALHQMFSMKEEDQNRTVEFALSGKGLDDEF